MARSSSTPQRASARPPLAQPGGAAPVHRSEERDRPGHRRFSLKMALRHGSLTLTEIVNTVPVYRHLGEQLSTDALKELVSNDIATLRASGEVIDYRQRRPQEEPAYHLDDSSNIAVDTSGLNMGLLVPLLDFKGREEPESFAQIGVRKALAAGERGARLAAGREPLILTIPHGRFAPTVAIAIQHRDFIRFEYQSLQEPHPTVRIAFPAALEVHGGEFYVRAWKCTAAEWQHWHKSSGHKRGAPEGAQNPEQRENPEQWESSENAWGEDRLRTYKVARMRSCEVLHTTAFPAVLEHHTSHGAHHALPPHSAGAEHADSGVCTERVAGASAADISSFGASTAFGASIAREPSATLGVREEGNTASWFAPITVVFAVQPGTCRPLVARSERLTAEQYRTDIAANAVGRSSHFLHNSEIYVLHGVNRFAFLEDCALYGADLQVLAPREYAHEVRQRIAYVAHLVGTSQAKTTATSDAGLHSPAPRTVASEAIPSAELNEWPTHARGMNGAMRSTARTAKSVDLTVPRRESYYTYLLRHGPTSLGEIAAHFSVDPLTVRRELRDLFTTEIMIAGQPQALYDLVMPEWEEGEPIDEKWQIEAVPPPSLNANSTPNADGISAQPIMSFTLAEIIALVGAIDSLLTVAIGDHQRTLLDMRARFVHAATASGYGTALWEPPNSRFAPGIVRAVAQAIEERAEITMRYWHATAAGRAQPQLEKIQPFAVDPQLNPLLVAANEAGEVRTFRLDRISSVEPTGAHFAKMPARNWAKTYRLSHRSFTGVPVQLICLPGARWAAEELPDVNVRMDSEQNVLILSLVVRNLQWLRSLLLRLGRDCVAIEPSAVSAQLAEAFHAIQSAYGLAFANAADEPLENHSE